MKKAVSLKMKRKHKITIVRKPVSAVNGYAKLYRNTKTRLERKSKILGQTQDPDNEAVSPVLDTTTTGSPNGRQSRQRKRPLIFDPSDVHEKRKYIKKESIPTPTPIPVSPDKKISRKISNKVQQNGGSEKLENEATSNSSGGRSPNGSINFEPEPAQLTDSKSSSSTVNKSANQAPQRRSVGRPRKSVSEIKMEMTSGESSSSDGSNGIPFLVRQDIAPAPRQRYESDEGNDESKESTDQERGVSESEDVKASEMIGNDEISRTRILFQDFIACDCTSTSMNGQVFAAVATKPEFCQARERYSNTLVGCIQPANKETLLYRVSPQNTLSVFCNLHISRLRLHQCCPYCGEFCSSETNTIRCSDGRLTENSRPSPNDTSPVTHLFHLTCAARYQQMVKSINGLISNWKSLTQLKCPHCGSEDMENLRKVRLTLKTDVPPVFLPEQGVLKLDVQELQGSRTIPNEFKESFTATATPKQPLLELAYASGKTTISIVPAETNTRNLVDKTYTDELEKVMKKAAAAETRADNSDQLETDFNVEELLLSAIERLDLAEIIGLVLKCHYSVDKAFTSRNNMTLLHLAVESRNMCFIHAIILMEPELDVFDDNDFTPLMMAAKFNEPDIIKYLIAAGADEHLCGAEGMNVLHIAIVSENFESVREIVESYPELINTKELKNGFTPLMIAAKKGFTSIAMYLIRSCRCNIQILDRQQNSAIHWAAHSGSVPIFIALQATSTELVEAKNSFGETAFDISFKENQGLFMMTILKKYPNVDVSRVLAKKDTEEESSERTIIRERLEEILEHRAQIMQNCKLAKVIRISGDISHGKESVPISCVNTEDDSVLPTDFHYITDLPLLPHCQRTNTKSLSESANSHNQVCRCNSTLEHAESCSSRGKGIHREPCNCHLQNPAGEQVYDSFGRLFTDKMTVDEFFFGPIYECNEICHCNVQACPNRVVQKGIQARLQVFRTKPTTTGDGRGWGVRALSKIPLGSFICEYIGETMTVGQLKSLNDDSCVFYQPNQLTEMNFGINSKEFGNVCRFINHSCTPNAVPINAFVHHESFSPLPRLALFAKQEIQAYEEITFNYGSTFWRIKTSREPNWKCLCGTAQCPHAPEPQLAADATSTMES